MLSTRRLLPWLASAVAFPLAGLAARAAAGPLDDLPAALAGGALVGAVVGAGQWLAARSLLPAPARWIAASAGGGAIGLAAGATAVSYATATADLAAMGAICGLPLGGAQAATLGRGRGALAWAATAPVAWGLGWTVTALIGVDVERQHAVFGIGGALAATALLALPLGVVARRRRADRSPRDRSASRRHTADTVGG